MTAINEIASNFNCATEFFGVGLQQRDAEHLLYAASKPGPGGSRPQLLTQLQLIDRLAAMAPPPRVHRHRYYGVLASNSPLRYAVTAMASPTATLAPTAPHPNPAPPADEPIHRRAARYAWALLLARIYEVFPLRCSKCGGTMRIIAFITDRTTVRDILISLGQPIAPRLVGLNFLSFSFTTPPAAAASSA